MVTDSFYRTPHLTTISFAVGVLLFLLPFLEIKCNGQTLAKIKGIDLITGSSPEMGNEFTKLPKGFEKADDISIDKPTAKDKQDSKPYVLAIIALALGVIGVIVSLTKKGAYNKTEMLLGIAGAVLLLILMFQVKSDVSVQAKTETKGQDMFSGALGISIDFTIWFYLCVLSYLSAAFFSYKQKQLAFVHEVPPSNAPQTHIQNPGDQSNFPPSPTGEKDLG